MAQNTITRSEIISRYLQDRDLGPLLLAQAYVESRLDPNAVSPAGAQGIAQFLPATWSDCITRGWIPAGSSPLDAAVAIRAQAAYMQWLLRQCHGNRRAALAAYNYGIGRITSLMRSPQWELRVPRETFAYIRQILTLCDWITDIQSGGAQ